MIFKVIFSILISMIFCNFTYATKRHAKVTGKDCKFCHRSKKGGDRNLNKEGKEYKIFLKDKKRIRRKKKTKLSKEKIQFWKNIIKKNRQQRKKNEKITTK